jgi:hypothetical protein
MQNIQTIELPSGRPNISFEIRQHDGYFYFMLKHTPTGATEQLTADIGDMVYQRAKVFENKLCCVETA